MCSYDVSLSTAKAPGTALRTADKAARLPGRVTVADVAGALCACALAQGNADVITPPPSSAASRNHWRRFVYTACGVISLGTACTLPLSGCAACREVRMKGMARLHRKDRAAPYTGQRPAAASLKFRQLALRASDLHQTPRQPRLHGRGQRRKARATGQLVTMHEAP